MRRKWVLEVLQYKYQNCKLNSQFFSHHEMNRHCQMNYIFNREARRPKRLSDVRTRKYMCVDTGNHMACFNLDIIYREIYFHIK
jgi:hypothetical protein